MTRSKICGKLPEEKAVGDGTMEEKTTSDRSVKKTVTIDDASKIEDREVPFEDLISELRY